MMNLAGIFSASKTHHIVRVYNLVPEGRRMMRQALTTTEQSENRNMHVTENRVPSSHCLRRRAQPQPEILVRHRHTLNIHETMWHKHATYAIAGAHQHSQHTDTPITVEKHKHLEKQTTRNIQIECKKNNDRQRKQTDGIYSAEICLCQIEKWCMFTNKRSYDRFWLENMWYIIFYEPRRRWP